VKDEDRHKVPEKFSNSKSEFFRASFAIKKSS
jgi:hypothetical protein